MLANHAITALLNRESKRSLRRGRDLSGLRLRWKSCKISAGETKDAKPAVLVLAALFMPKFSIVG